MSGLGNIIFNLTFLSMIFLCLRRACLIYFPAKLRLYLVLKTRGIAVDFNLSLMKCWRSSKLIEESALESSASLYPLAESFSMKKPFFLTSVSRLLLLFVCLFCIADDLTSKETVEEWRNTHGPTPSNRRQDHEDHSSCPFRTDTHRETFQTSKDRWSMS